MLSSCAAACNTFVAERAEQAGMAGVTPRRPQELSEAPCRLSDMDQLPAFIVAFGVGVALGALVTWLIVRAQAQARLAGVRASVAAALAERDAARERAADMARDRGGLENTFRVLSENAIERQGRRADETAEQRLRATEALLTPVKESLERFNKRLADVEVERATMAAQLRGQVNEVVATGERLRRETSALSTALRKPQVRGAWGELQLKRVVEVAGMVEHCDFAQQQTGRAASDATIRPDMTIMLSERAFVFVDAKVPLAAFLEAQDAESDAERDACLKRFAANVRGHIDQLGGKNYFTAGPGTPEFVVMFLASEALGAEAFAQIPDLFDYATRRGVMIATPTTLIAMLRAVAYSWKQAALSDSAREVFAVGRELYARMAKLGEHFDRVGRSLAAATGAYNDAVGSIEGRVFPMARRFRDLAIVDDELAPIHPQDVTVRVLSAVEFAEQDADHVAART